MKPPLFDWQEKDESYHGIEPIFTPEDIAGRVDELATVLARWFDDEPVGQVVMNGAFMFAADMTRALSARGIIMEMDFITVEKNRRTGERSLTFATNRPVADKDVLIIDDIFETGNTLLMARDHFMALGASSVTSVVLLDKSKGQNVGIKPDYVGFECPDIFVIGYGMDIGYRFRELPFIGKLGQA